MAFPLLRSSVFYKALQCARWCNDVHFMRSLVDVLHNIFAVVSGPNPNVRRVALVAMLKER